MGTTTFPRRNAVITCISVIYIVVCAFNIQSEQQNSNKNAKRGDFCPSFSRLRTKIVIFLEYAACGLYFQSRVSYHLKRLTPTYGRNRCRAV